MQRVMLCIYIIYVKYVEYLNNENPQSSNNYESTV